MNKYRQVNFYDFMTKMSANWTGRQAWNYWAYWSGFRVF